MQSGRPAEAGPGVEASTEAAGGAAGGAVGGAAQSAAVGAAVDAAVGAAGGDSRAAGRGALAAAASHGFECSGAAPSAPLSCRFLLVLATASTAPSLAFDLPPQNAVHQKVGRGEPTSPSLQKETGAPHSTHAVLLYTLQGGCRPARHHALENARTSRTIRSSASGPIVRICCRGSIPARCSA
eukprot:1275283-Prymnesium_polylepis.1